MGPVAVGELKVINIRRRVTEEDVIWTDLVWDALKETVVDFAEMASLWMCLEFVGMSKSTFVDVYVEETTAVGTLHLLDHDVRHDHLQCTLQSSAHASNRSAGVQLSPHSDSSSPRLTPSPSPRANPIVFPSEPQTSPESMYDASISSAGVSGKSRNRLRYMTYWALSLMRTWLMSPSGPYIGGGTLDDSESERGRENNGEDGVNGSESVGKALLVGDGRRHIKLEETRRLSSLFMESSLAKSRTYCFTTGPRSSTSLTNLHPSSSFSPSPRTALCIRRTPSPTSRSRFSLTICKGEPSTSLLSNIIVQLREGSPDSHVPSDGRSHGEHDDEDEHGDSNTHSGSDSESGCGSSSESEGRSPSASQSLVRSREFLSITRTVPHRRPSPRSTPESLTAVAGVEGSSTMKPSPQPGMVSGWGLSNWGHVGVGERTAINVRRGVAEGDVMWNRRGLGCVEKDGSGIVRRW
ncbi:hypothetical protein BU17DRAFT_79732 [Hysterangium stoloniferum]|nr:hypothetical protein BU17DRAFT_79732 [Hysterangium stoloniferum]